MSQVVDKLRPCADGGGGGSEHVQNGALAGTGRIESKLGLHAAGVARRRCGPAFAAFSQFGFGHVQLKHQFVRIDGDAVAFMHKRDVAAGCRFLCSPNLLLSRRCACTVVLRDILPRKLYVPVTYRRVTSPSYPWTLELRLGRLAAIAWNTPGLASPSSLVETGDQ